ncbi:hypothetical protein [Mycolicibacterium neoaurum]|uniref:hypothetical protein n=1 Tax=Mycolicibacterium neoaurum TaxID=1795 RepID=UPI00056ADF44|nr:hypothetical protein [Mycolicibacterium neoaurum]
MNIDAGRHAGRPREIRRDGLPSRDRYDRPVRHSEIVESELRLAAAVRRALAEPGESMPSTTVLDELLDERNAGRVVSH